jgi:RNA polymerase sigma factor (sigma-70 family)
LGVGELAATDAAAREVAIEAFHAHGPVLLATARLITLDRDEANDLVQTTFELGIRHIDAVRDLGALRAWLLRIETREAFRLVRRLRRVVSLDGQVRELAAADADPTGRAALRGALAALPRRTRAAVALHYLAGLSVAETAVAMGISENTVKSQLKTGLARLREELADD